MTLDLPYDLWVQAIIALLAGIVAAVLGLQRIEHTWAYDGPRSVRDFLLGFMFLAIGISWVVIAGGIVTTLSLGESVGTLVQEVVIFTNSFTRMVVIVCGSYALLRRWQG